MIRQWCARRSGTASPRRFWHEIGRAEGGLAREAAWSLERGHAGRRGRLVFQGTVDGRFLALDAKTGEELWSYNNRAATLAGPISYEVDGEQYVVGDRRLRHGLLPHQRLLRADEGLAVNARVHAFKLGGRPETA